VQDTTRWLFLPQDFLRVGIGLPRVHDERQIQFPRQSRLRAKHLPLPLPGRILVMVVKTGLTDADYFSVSGQPFDELKVPVFNTARVMRMNTGTREDPIVLLRDWNAASHVIRTTAVANRQNLPDSGIPRALQYGVAIRFKTSIIQMSMRVDKHDSGIRPGYFNRAPFETSSWKPTRTGLSSGPSDAATIMPLDSSPRNFLGWRLATMTTLRPMSASG